MSRKCEHCNGQMPENKRSDSHYCSEKCRKYASKQRRERAGNNRKAGKTSLSGIPVTQVVSPQVPAVVKQEPVKSSPLIPPAELKEPELTYAMMPPLRGYVEDAAQVNFAKLPPPPEPPPVFAETEPLPIQKEYKHYNVSVSNPEYKRLSEAGSLQERKIVAQYNLVVQHEQKLKQVKEAVNVSTLQYLGFGATGGVVGRQMSENKGSGTFWGILGGFLTAFVYDWSTEDQFKIQKAQAIARQTELVNASRKYLALYQQELEIVKNALRAQSELLSEPRTKLLNSDAVAQREREIREYQQRKEASEQLWEKYRQDVAEYEAKYGSIEAINAAYAKAEDMPQAEVNDSGVVSSLGLNKVVGGALVLKGAWRTFLGAPSRDFKLVIHGPSFSGKSHLTLQFAHYLTLHHGTVLYNTSEEGFSRTMDAKLEKLGARAKGLDIGRYITIKELKEKIPRTAYNFIVLDSVSDMNMSAEDLQELRRYYCCSAIIAICQNTKDGKIRGGYDLVHDHDIKIRVEEKIAYTDKNRFIDDLPKLEIFNIPPIPVTQKTDEPKQEQSGGKIIPMPGIDNVQKKDQEEEQKPLPPVDPGTNKRGPDDELLWEDINGYGHIP